MKPIEVAEMRGMKYRFVADNEEARRRRCGLPLGPNSIEYEVEPEKDARLCILCEKPISFSYWFCQKCAKKLGIFGKPYIEWPDVVKFLLADKRREINAERDSGWDEISDELPSGADVTSPDFRETEVAFDAKDLSFLEDYGLTEEQYEIITTDNPELLAESLGITSNALYLRKTRLMKKLEKRQKIE